MKYLKTLLSVFHGKSNENKMLELVELIEKKPEVTLAEAAKKLYNDPKSKGFLVMKARLMERLYEVILASPSISNNPIVEEDENAYAYIQLQKEFALAIALRRRGLIELSKNILQQCLKNPHTHINLSFKVMLLEYFRTSVDNMEDLQQVNRDLEMTIPQQKLLMEVIGFTDEIRILEKLDAYNSNKYIQFLSTKISYLEEMVQQEKYYNPKTYFKYLWLKLDLLNVLKDTQNAQAIIDEMGKLFSIHPEIETNNRKGIKYLRLAESNLSVNEYENAIKNVEQACLYFKNRPNNYWISKTVECFGLFYLKEWEKISNIIENFRSFQGVKSKDAENLFLYFELCIAYLSGKAKYVIQKIHELEVAYSNKENTNTMIRIFEIMILIELEENYFAELKIDALRKHIEKYEINPRNLRCYRILNQLQLQSFNFQKESDKININLRELETEYKWQAYSFEIIQFETWYSSLKIRVSYWELFKLQNRNALL